MSTRRWLLQATKGFRGALTLSFLQRVFGLVAYIAMLCTAVLAIVHQQWSYVLLTGVLGLVKAALRYGEQFAGHWVAFKVLEQLRAQAFGYLLPTVGQPRGNGEAPREEEDVLSGDVVERLTKDIDRIEVFYAHTIVPVCSAMLAPIVGAIAVRWATGSGAAVLVLFGACAVVWLAALIGLPTMSKANVDAAASRGRLSHLITDAIFGHAEIHSYQMQPQMRARVNAAETELHRPHVTLARWAALRAGCSTAGILGGASTMLLLGLPWDAAALGVLIVVAVGTHIAAVEQLAPSLGAAFAAAGRVLALRPEPAQPLEPWPEGNLKLHEARLEQGVTQELAPGEHAVIQGPSGVGKTRLLRTIMQLDAAADTHIGATGTSSIEPTDLRRHIAYAPQKAETFPGSIRFNLTLGGEVDQQWLHRVLGALELSEHIEAQGGLDARMGQWSGGQTARLGIARVLVCHDPERLKYVLLDEPTAHLDEALAARVRSNIRDLVPDAGIIEVSHRQTGPLDSVVEEKGVQTASAKPLHAKHWQFKPRNIG